jgi:hypothetical protein
MVLLTIQKVSDTFVVTLPYLLLTVCQLKTPFPFSPSSCPKRQRNLCLPRCIPPRILDSLARLPYHSTARFMSIWIHRFPNFRHHAEGNTGPFNETRLPDAVKLQTSLRKLFRHGKLPENTIRAIMVPLPFCKNSWHVSTVSRTWGIALVRRRSCLLLSAERSTVVFRSIRHTPMMTLISQKKAIGRDEVGRRRIT